MQILKSVVLVVTLLATTSAYAFDENREGFLLSLGAGLHSIKNEYSSNGTVTANESKSGLATSFKIGGGITNQFALYYVRNASWFSTPITNGVVTKDATAVIGMGGIGGTYFFEPTSPSGYMLAAIGGADYAFPMESVNTQTGGAFMLGGGYEFSKHVMLEATLMATSVSDSSFSSYKTKSSSFQVTLNYMFY